MAWLNNLPPDAKLRIGQRLMLPNQSYLDTGRQGREKFLALAYYTQTHGGRLPPAGAKLPSLDEQVFGAPFRREVKNGYAYDIDIISRTRRIGADLVLAAAPKRSATVRRRAGGADRLRTDDGGHYIAARFGGPRDSFNHFAQDANFNRGGHRALEDEWAKSLRNGGRVRVRITPGYTGASQRPDSIEVVYVIDGHRRIRVFPNSSRKRTNVGR